MTIPSLDVHYTTGGNDAYDVQDARHEADHGATSRACSRIGPTRRSSATSRRRSTSRCRNRIRTPGSAGLRRAWAVPLALALAALAVVKRQSRTVARGMGAGCDRRPGATPITDSADAEAAYNEVVDVLREYFELEFNVPTLSRTTREFLTEATNVVGLRQDGPRAAGVARVDRR